MQAGHRDGTPVRMATEPGPPTYWAFRELLAGDIRRGAIKTVTRSALIVRAWHYEVLDEESREFADRSWRSWRPGGLKGETPPDGAGCAPSPTRLLWLWSNSPGGVGSISGPALEYYSIKRILNC
jgi:hypothetical protein